MSDKNLVFNTWVDELADATAKEIHKAMMLTHPEKNIGKKLATRFIRYYVKLVVLNSLNEHTDKKLSNEEAYKLTKQGFLELKMDLQSQISLAFELAFKDYVGKQPEYFCTINPVPEMTSKAVN